MAVGFFTTSTTWEGMNGESLCVSLEGPKAIHLAGAGLHSGHRCISAFPQAGPQLHLAERCSSCSLSLGTRSQPDPSTLVEPNWSFFVSRLCFLVFGMNFSATAWVPSNFIKGKRKCFLSLINHCFHSFIWKLFTLVQKRTYDRHEDIGVDMAHLKRHLLISLQGCPGGAVVKSPPTSAGGTRDASSVPG